VSITVTIVFSTKPREVIEKVIALEEGATVAQALSSSGLAQQFPEMTSATAGVGIWDKKVGLAHILRDQDRLELYRPLTVDPKVARRERFVGQGAKKAAGLFAKRRAGAKAGY
jgi:putative ubiquitin-RnfH superfamily antitoxin RatB of RatAB toxin-antitoxin module